MAVRIYNDYYVACHFYNDTIPPVIRFGPYQDFDTADELAKALSKAECKRYSVLERKFEYDDTWETVNNNNTSQP